MRCFDGYKTSGRASTFQTTPKPATKPPLQRPKTAQARFCIITKGLKKPENGAHTKHRHSSFGSPLGPVHSESCLDLHATRPQSACLKQQGSNQEDQRHQRSSSKQNSDTCSKPNSLKKMRPSSAHSGASTQCMSPSIGIGLKEYASESALGDMLNVASPRAPPKDRRSLRVPGLEMSGVTAEQLYEAGMLYTDEQGLLRTPVEGNVAQGGAAPGEVAKVSKPVARKPPTPQNQRCWRKRASSIGLQAATGLANPGNDPDMCKVRLCTHPRSSFVAGLHDYAWGKIVSESNGCVWA
jgi:hypothetical protein